MSDAIEFNTHVTVVSPSELRTRVQASGWDITPAILYLLEDAISQEYSGIDGQFQLIDRFGDSIVHASLEGRINKFGCLFRFIPLPNDSEFLYDSSHGTKILKEEDITYDANDRNRYFISPHLIIQIAKINKFIGITNEVWINPDEEEVKLLLEKVGLDYSPNKLQTVRDLVRKIIKEVKLTLDSYRVKGDSEIVE